MHIGYACINTELGCTSNSTFRLSSYSEERLVETVGKNLDCLNRILDWNLKNGILFFRIGSQLVPFASHPICNFDWRGRFEKRFAETGRFARENGMRITMHPDQFVIINAKNNGIVERSFGELDYHCAVLDSMGMKQDSKIVLHVGGAYGEKEKSMERFVRNYRRLPECVKKRLVIENDHRLFSIEDCLRINERVGVPVIADNLHHECLNSGESFPEAASKAAGTWKKPDGSPILHYSEQKKGALRGSHSETISVAKFLKFAKSLPKRDFDVMLEVKDKEQSALKAMR